MTSRFWTVLTKGALGFIAALLIFSAGMKVGELRAQFSYRLAESYSENFGGVSDRSFEPVGEENGKESFIKSLKQRFQSQFFNGHGVYGEVIKTAPNYILVKDRDGSEKLIVITDRTTIRKGPRDISPRDVQLDEMITVIGSPNEHGQIEARFIRIFPTSSGIIMHHPVVTGFRG